MNDILQYFLAWHEQLIDPARIPTTLVAILIAVVVGSITGPLGGNANPMLWMMIDRLFGTLGGKMNKAGRPLGDLMFRGMVLAIITAIFAFALGMGLQKMGRAYPQYNMLETVFLSLFISVGSVWFALLKLYFALADKKQKVEGAYLNISRTARANLNVSDDFGITRLAMGLTAKTFDKGLVAPVFWYLIGGLPLVALYTGLATLSWRFALDGQDKGFAKVIIALENLLGFVPSAFSAAILTAASAITPTALIGRAMQGWFGVKGRANYAQGGLPLSVIAWALRLSLGGAYQTLEGKAVKAPWVGPSGITAKNDFTHLRRALILNVVAVALFIVSLASAYIWAGL